MPKEKDIFTEKNKIPAFITNSKLLKNNNTVYNYEINEETNEGNQENNTYFPKT